MPPDVVFRPLISDGITLHIASADARRVRLVSGAQLGGGLVGKLYGAQALTAAGAAAVLDGPMFDDGGARGARPRFLLYDRVRGVHFPSREPSAGSTLVVSQAGAVDVYDGAHLPADAAVAIQCYPQLVGDGRPVAVGDTDSNNARVWRAALAVTPSKRVLLVVAIASLPAFARALAAMGCTWAGYTDGGSSTELRLRTGDRVGYAPAPAVPVWIAATGGLDAPGSSGGDSAGGDLVPVLAVLGVLVVGAVLVSSSSEPDPVQLTSENPRKRRKKRS